MGPFINNYTELSNDTIEFKLGSTLLPADILAAVEKCTQIMPAIHCGSGLTVEGTEYKQDCFADCRFVDGKLQMGKIELYLPDSRGAAAVVVNMCETLFQSHLGVYKLCFSQANKSVVCILTRNLADYPALPGYDIYRETYIVLKHALFDRV